MTKNFTFVLLMTFLLGSCRSVERATICHEVAKYQVEPTEACVVSMKHLACFCGPFDVNTWEFTGELVEDHLDKCDGIVGVQTSFGIQHITPNFTALQRLREESCKVKE